MFRRRDRQVLGPQPRISRGEPLSLAGRYLERALYFFAKEDYENALADIDAAIEAAPKDGELYATRGFILSQTHREADAKDDLDYALRRDARQWLAYYTLGMMAFRRKEYDEAIKQFSMAQRYAPYRVEIYFARAIAHYQNGDTNKALQDADIADQVIDPKDKRRRDVKALIVQIKKFAG